MDIEYTIRNQEYGSYLGVNLDNDGNPYLVTPTKIDGKEDFFKWLVINRRPAANGNMYGILYNIHTDSCLGVSMELHTHRDLQFYNAQVNKKVGQLFDFGLVDDDHLYNITSQANGQKSFLTMSMPPLQDNVDPELMFMITGGDYTSWYLTEV